MAPKCGGIALGHVGINVSDIEISKTFYQEVLGLAVGEESHQVPTWQNRRQDESYGCAVVGHLRIKVSTR